MLASALGSEEVAEGGVGGGAGAAHLASVITSCLRRAAHGLPAKRDKANAPRAKSAAPSANLHQVRQPSFGCLYLFFSPESPPQTCLFRFVDLSAHAHTADAVLRLYFHAFRPCKWGLFVIGPDNLLGFLWLMLLCAGGHSRTHGHAAFANPQVPDRSCCGGCRGCMGLGCTRKH